MSREDVVCAVGALPFGVIIFFFKQKTAYEIGLGIPAEPLFRSRLRSFAASWLLNALLRIFAMSIITPKKKGIKDECSRLLEASTMKSRRGFAIQRLMNAMRQAHADGWFIVFDTLTLADDRLEAFYDNPNALRDYFRDIGRMVLAAEGRKANDSHADCY